MPGASMGDGKESHGAYFGLLKRDGAWKPAMPLFRDGWPGAESAVAAPPLSSTTRPDPPPSRPPARAPPPTPPHVPPPCFPQTGHYIQDVFRDYWRRFGGLEIFGYPITEQ